MNRDEQPVVVEQVFSQSKEAVWQAITNLADMRQWFFDNIPVFKAEVGFETQFNIQNEDRHFMHLWTVTEVQVNQVIVYNWKYAGYPGDSFVKFELLDHDPGTKLRLTHEVTKSFPQHIPEFKRENGLAGWTYFIQQRLKAFLA